MSDELHFLTIARASELVRARKLSPVELTQALLARTAALDPCIHAFITVTAERALAQARAAEAEIAAGRHRGPLHGIPFGLKDIYCTAGILTTGNSRVCADNVPSADATAVSRLYESGAVLLGKLATHEFAHGGPSHDLPWPVPRNPWNNAHYVGGSSSGSAAAIAAGLVPAALGSDTGASIRNPAGLAGVVGLKPTYGLVSRHGVMPNSYSFDHCGPMTWTVEDCALVLQAIAGHDPRDPASVRCTVPDYRAALREDLRGIRVGVLRHFWEEDLAVSPEAAAGMEAALDALRRLGAEVSTARMRPLQAYYDVKIAIAETEIFAIHRRNLIARPGDYGADFLRRTLGGCVFHAADYVQAQRERRVMVEEASALLERFDVCVSVGAGPAGRLDRYENIDFWRKPSLYSVFNVTGGPTVSICNGYGANGLPLSMQIAGRPFDEATVLRIAHAYERATAWRDRRPDLVPGSPPAPVAAPRVSGVPELDPSDLRLVESSARHSGLALGPREHALLLEGAPYALAMARRIRRDHDDFAEPASVFVLPTA